MHRPPPLPPVADLARPELKLAGVRIDPALNARSRMGHYERLTVAAFTGDTVLPVRDGGGETPVTVSVQRRDVHVEKERPHSQNPPPSIPISRALPHMHACPSLFFSPTTPYRATRLATSSIT